MYIRDLVMANLWVIHDLCHFEHIDIFHYHIVKMLREQLHHHDVNAYTHDPV